MCFNESKYIHKIDTGQTNIEYVLVRAQFKFFSLFRFYNILTKMLYFFHNYH